MKLRAIAFANDWRRQTMAGIVGQHRPAFNMGDVHRSTPRVLAQHDA